MTIGWTDIRREPFRLLFPLGVLFGCLGISHWLWYALGWSGASQFVHASIQIGAYLYCFIAGFLWTAMPRMTGAPPATSAELLAVLVLLTSQQLALGLRMPIAAQGCFAGLLVMLATFAIRRMARRHGPSGPPTEFVWVLIGVLFGLIGSALAIFGQSNPGSFPWTALGRPFAQQGFVLAVVLGVGGFMAPRLMGRGFEWSGGRSVAPEAVARIRRQRIAWHLVAAVVLAASFAAEGLGLVRVAYAVRAAVVSAELFWTTRLYRPPAVPDGYAKLLWISLWMVITGFWAVAIWPRYRIALLHLVLIGGFSLMTFAVGTMVVLSHAGLAQRLRQPLWILHVVGIGVLGAAIARVLADLWPIVYFPLLAMASSLWLIGGIVWIVFALPYVLTRLPGGAMERLHEEARHRLLQQNPSVAQSSAA